MLSHPAKTEIGEASVATATSQLREAAPNRRRHSTVGGCLGNLNPEFFRNWFVEGSKGLFNGHFNSRSAGFMIAAAIPGILIAAFLTIPGMLFQTPDHQAFYYFAKSLEGDSSTVLPVLLGTISAVFSLRFTLGA